MRDKIYMYMYLVSCPDHTPPGRGEVWSGHETNMYQAMFHAFMYTTCIISPFSAYFFLHDIIVEKGPLL